MVDLHSAGFLPNAERFYDPGYHSTMKQMIAYVIALEGPIYDDVVVTRIARAHGFQRSGSNIQRIVLDAVGREFPRTKENEREVLWPIGAQVDGLVPFRNCDSDIRPHGDIPIGELASLAVPFIRLRMSHEDILGRMADHFALERLREATRQRFEAAVKVAKIAIL